jgi:hypothetical protein
MKNSDLKEAQKEPWLYQYSQGLGNDNNLLIVLSIAALWDVTFSCASNEFLICSYTCHPKHLDTRIDRLRTSRWPLSLPWRALVCWLSRGIYGRFQEALRMAETSPAFTGTQRPKRNDGARKPSQALFF